MPNKSRMSKKRTVFLFSVWAKCTCWAFRSIITSYTAASVWVDTLSTCFMMVAWIRILIFYIGRKDVSHELPSWITHLLVVKDNGAPRPSAPMWKQSVWFYHDLYCCCCYHCSHVTRLLWVKSEIMLALTVIVLVPILETPVRTMMKTIMTMMPRNNGYNK